MTAIVEQLRWFGRAAPLALSFMLLACVSNGGESARDYGPAAVAVDPLRMFATGYDSLMDIYIDDVPLSQVSMAGLDGLSNLDADLSVENRNYFVTLYRDGQVLGTFPVPRTDDVGGWSRLTANAIEAARAGSPEIAGAGDERVYEVVFDGIISELDEYSRYSSAEEARESRANRTGFGGIGIRIDMQDEGVLVVNVMEDTPAEHSGLKDNDLIVGIDGVPAKGMDQHEVVRRLRGRIGSQVGVRIRREGFGDFDVRIVRDKIVPQTVHLERRGNAAYIQLTGFNQDTTRTLREHLRQARAEYGPTLNGIILDMRNNPGGLLDQAVEVSDIFVPRGRIVSTHGRHRDSHQLFDADSADELADLPVVVLINGGSASAAEIVAAALQDAGRAIVIGSTSYGKGTVQTVMPLPNNGELTLTWALFYAPSGYPLDRLGVLPTICTSDDNTSVDKVVARLARGALPAIDTALRASADRDNKPVLERLRSTCPPRTDRRDIDIEMAQRVLSDRTLYAGAVRLADPSQAAQHVGTTAAGGAN